LDGRRLVVERRRHAIDRDELGLGRGEPDADAAERLKRSRRRDRRAADPDPRIGEATLSVAVRFVYGLVTVASNFSKPTVPFT